MKCEFEWEKNYLSKEVNFFYYNIIKNSFGQNNKIV